MASYEAELQQAAVGEDAAFARAAANAIPASTEEQERHDPEVCCGLCSWYSQHVCAVSRRDSSGWPDFLRISICLPTFSTHGNLFHQFGVIAIKVSADQCSAGGALVVLYKHNPSVQVCMHYRPTYMYAIMSCAASRYQQGHR